MKPLVLSLIFYIAFNNCINDSPKKIEISDSVSTDVVDSTLAASPWSSIKLERRINTHGEFGGTIEEIEIYRVNICDENRFTEKFECQALMANYRYLLISKTQPEIDSLRIDSVQFDSPIDKLLSKALVELENGAETHLKSEFLPNNDCCPLFQFSYGILAERPQVRISSIYVEANWRSFDEILKLIKTK